MTDIIGWVFRIAALFGLEIVALFILIMSTIYGRQRIFVIFCGVVAAVLMAIETSIWWICTAGGHEFGFRSDITLLVVSAVSIVCLAIYFPIAITRCKRKLDSAASIGP